jgi:hypothetical protein
VKFWEQAKKVAIGAGVAAGGAALTYLTEYVSGTDFGAFTPVVVAGLSILANVLRKAVGL